MSVANSDFDIFQLGVSGALALVVRQAHHPEQGRGMARNRVGTSIESQPLLWSAPPTLRVEGGTKIIAYWDIATGTLLSGAKLLCAKLSDANL